MLWCAIKRWFSAGEPELNKMGSERSFGVVFAPQAEVAAAELARVCRGRIGLTAWEPHPEQRIWEPYLGTPANTAWSSEEGIRRLLPGFELEFEHATWWLEAESGEAAWE